MKTLPKSMESGVLLIFKELIIRYTKGKSSSVKEDNAFNILNSIYYSINAYMQCYGKQERCSDLIYEEDVDFIYKKGVEIVKKYTEECRKIYKNIKENKLNIPLEVYNDTIDNLEDFFNNYDEVFGAYDIPCSIDYPLTFDNMSLTGIFYIKQYIEKLKMETDFCDFFKQSSIRKILRDYGRKYRIDIIKSPINVFQVLLEQSIFVLLCGNNEITLEISPHDREMIKRSLFEKNGEELKSILKEIFKGIIVKFNIRDKKLIDYIKMYENPFIIRFLNTYNNGNLSNMIIIENEKSREDKIVFTKGSKMNDYEFTSIVEEVMECRYVKDKINIIALNLKSFEDYMDLLDSECLFGSEYIEVFSTLNDMSLAVLGKTVFYDDLNCNSLNLSYEELIKYRDNMESEWQNYFIEFLLSLPEKKIKNVENIIVKIDLEENLI
ncbi:DUF6179 domain-containing protein [Clostridium sp.]|uniref:DUF6179 domain-containing protein n=1 Tax=Clostridium sp. TaxID=1506 RepID=UPI002FDE1CEE